MREVEKAPDVIFQDHAGRYRLGRHLIVLKLVSRHAQIHSIDRKIASPGKAQMKHYNRGNPSESNQLSIWHHGRGIGCVRLHLQDGLERGRCVRTVVVENEDPAARQ